MPNYSPSNGNNLTINHSTAGRELQIPLGMAELERNIESLVKVSEDLSARLNKICQPEPPNEIQVAGGIPGNPPAEFVQALFIQSERVRRACENLENILARLEL
jgi:hypothetical protein